VLTRAIAAFLILPGTVGFALPIWIGINSGARAHYRAPAAALLCVGTGVLLWCAREFYVCGHGTLAPWSPPVRLVTTGPYRMSRNPIYLAVATILAGWCVLWDSGTLRIYSAVSAVAFIVRVLAFEEPWAARHFGAEWQAYRARVRRWL
jgi:protein-S-isoprenylcysteine O-methyltransferase Ste14